MLDALIIELLKESEERLAKIKAELHIDLCETVEGSDKFILLEKREDYTLGRISAFKDLLEVKNHWEKTLSSTKSNVLDRSH